ncbi:MAG: SDR family oxidoreductase [Bacillus sp. (in: Bacteria)]|nr:SDR family oxidoreductase [Bacillus sp. (in: firmicutes)]
MKLFITGGTGFLGTELIKKLLLENHHVYVLVRSKKKMATLLSNIPDVLHSKLEAIEGDISSPSLGLQEDVKESLKYTIDAFYHSAALLSFDPKDANKLYEVNFLGTKNTLEFAKEIGVSAYYYISTAYTLGKQTKALEVLHDSSEGYHNAYEETKSKAEHLVMSYSDRMKVSIFRPSIIVGHSKTGECDSTFGLYGFVKGIEVFNKRISRSGKNTNNQRFRIVADPNGTQNIVPVDYVVDVLYAGLTEAKTKQIYHITNPEPPTNLDIFQ